MLWTLLKRGLLVGLLAGLLAGAYAFAFGEGRVQDAIDVETATATQVAHAHGMAAPHEEELVSRDGQRAGLVLGTTLFGLLVGTGFALVQAVLLGRTRLDAVRLALVSGAAGFAALVLLPFVKYPPNPPAVGRPETIGERTALYVALLAIGLAALVAAVRVARAVGDDVATWRGPLAGTGAFVALAALAVVVLPGVHEVPADFPAQLLWDFRLASLGTNAVLWVALGVGFALATARAASRAAAEERVAVA